MKDADDQLVWYALDPETGQWKTLPPMPISIQEEEAKAEMGQQQGSDSLMKLYGKWMIRVIFGDRIRLKGCSAAVLDGCLFVVGGCLRAPLDSVWRYDARTETWSTVCRMDTARAFCKTACLHNKLYAIGGVQLGVQDGVYPIQSAEVYDPTTNQWSPAGMFCFSRKDPAASTAHMSKPMATSVVSYHHKLCLSHSLYSQYVNVGGEVYEPMSNTWSKMPRGMVDGWPAPQLGTKLNTVVNGEMVALDPTNSLDGVRLKLYDNQNDEWKIVCTRIPISFDLVYPDSPCVVAGFKTKLYSVTKEYNGSVSVLCVDLSSLSDCDVKVWKTIASRSFGFVKLVTCQVLDI
ncbi:hypothetical protein O6H91_Y136600 [Diphasiastrum complanatum]|nr:hypothetical protein O6H91_Y136600 [Diphasiastrum complanatum]